MLLTVTNLKKYFPVTQGIMGRTVGYVKAVDGVTLHVEPSEVLGLVGESGCGKSTAARCIARLYEPTAGSIHFEDVDLASLQGAALRAARQRFQIIFQDPLSSLNPRMSVEEILIEPLAIHGLYKGPQRRARVQSLLDRVGLARSAMARYPHEFSGGQCQRIGIARALVLNPRLIIADEPVSALDVSVQAQIINLLEELRRELQLAYLFISHDLGVVWHISQRIAVMYLGVIVESGPTDAVCSDPLHPYSQALMAAAPAMHNAARGRPRTLLSGDVPSPVNPPSGCLFHTRCPIARSACSEKIPALIDVGNGRLVRCPYTQQ